MKALKAEDIISEDTSCLILYGTQLGNAQAIAEGLLDTAISEYFLNPKLFTLNELCDIAEFAKIRVPVIIVTSTTGDGDAPENADKFFRKIRRKLLKANTLEGVRYTILGLGDTNFNNFCNCGKLTHKRLQELGATLFYNPGWADDAVGLEEVVEPWTEDLWPSLQAAIDDSENKSPIKDSSPEKSLKSQSPVKKLFSRMIAKDKEQAESVPRSSAVTSTTVTENGETAVTLTLPACPKSSLALEFKEKVCTEVKVDLLKPPAPYPQIDGDPRTGVIENGRLLTAGNSVKTTVELTIRIGEGFEFEPGDAIGIVCHNPASEVDRVIELLCLEDVADKMCALTVKAEAKGKIPAHIPKDATATVRQMLTWYCDIRTPVKKAMLRLLADSCTDNSEKNTLLELCSKQGSELYEKHVRQASTSLLDLLLKFPTCKPPIAALLEHLPRLIPRPYSISSSPLHSANTFTIAFNIIEFPTDDTDTAYRKYERLGACTGWLAALGAKYFGKDTDALVNKFQLLSITPDMGGAGDASSSGVQPQIVFYRRKNHNFRLPKTLEPSVIMVGPGTGVAPFIGFIQHRRCQKSTGAAGKMYLYFGCRHKERDFLYGDVLKKFQDDGDLAGLYTTFSRDPVPGGETHYKYVQDMMWENKEELVKLLLDEGAYFYVCGDAKNMAKNVREKLIGCIQTVKGLSEADAMAKISELVSGKKYLQDVWS